MKILSAVLLALLLTNSYAQEPWHEYLKRAHENADYCQEFYDVTEAAKSNDATSKAYFGLATMMLGKLHDNPFTKLSYFNKGKVILEDAIEMEPSNAEIRFLRFVVQNRVPAILLYYHDKKTDKVFIDEYLIEYDNSFTQRVKEYYEFEDLTIEHVQSMEL